MIVGGEMNDIDLKARLLMGLDIPINGITIKNYTIGYIFKEIGLVKYSQIMNLVSLKPRDFMGEIDNNTHMYDILTSNQYTLEWLVDFVSLFIDGEWIYIPIHNEFFNSKIRMSINKSNIDDIFYIVKKMYCLDTYGKESDRDDIDDEMRELLLEFEEEERKVRMGKGCGITTLSIVESVASKHPNLNLNSIWDYSMYKLMRTFYRLEHIESNNKTMTGIYSGVIDSKKINLEKIHWANDLDI
ncbi:MAG: hypothetical protein ACRC1P_11450 [Cellulosilyticaceae bacterium]